MILDDTLRPITDAMGLLHRNSYECAEALRAWRSTTHAGGVELRRLQGVTLREQILAVCPLVDRGVSREVIIPVTPEWSAYFGNGWRGTDLSSVVPMLSRNLGCLAIAVTCTPDLGRRPHKRYGARIVEVYAASATAIRAIWASNDGGRWVSGTTGQPVPEEDAAWMAPPSAKDRFTQRDLRQFVSRMVPGALDTDTWLADPSFCVASRGATVVTATEHDLAEVQQRIPTTGSRSSRT